MSSAGKDSRPKRWYRLYIDESGDHTFDHVDRLHHRYLLLLGVWIQQDEPYRMLVNSLRNLKDEFFNQHPDSPICLHRKDLMQARGPFWRLRDPATRERFDQSLLDLLTSCDYRVCGVLLDKQEHRSKTYRALYHPYHYCLAALLERYAGWLQHRQTVGDVMAESRGGTEDRELRKVFDHLRQGGTRYHSGEAFRSVLTSKKIKLRKKQHVTAGLELADLLAHPVRRAMIDEEQERSRRIDDFGGRLLETIDPKFNCHTTTGRISGYGRVFLR